MKDYITRNKQDRLSKKIMDTPEYRIFKKKYQEAKRDPRVKPGWFTIWVWNYFPDSWYSKWRYNKMRQMLCEIMQVSESYFIMMVKYL